jgi:hypothetical protein
MPYPYQLIANTSINENKTKQILYILSEILLKTNNKEYAIHLKIIKHVSQKIH